MSCSLNLKNVSLSLDEKTLFKNINLDVGHKEKVAIIGANGVGKTTLLKIIAGLQTSFKGELHLFHNQINSKKDYEKFRGDIGYLPQNVIDYFLSPTVIEDVMFSLRTKGFSFDNAFKEAKNILEELNIGHLENKSIYELSGGEQKIVAIASILVSKPKILLLDEPTNALDEKSENNVIEILNKIEKSMIIISHHKAFIEKLTPTIYQLYNDGLKLI